MKIQITNIALHPDKPSEEIKKYLSENYNIEIDNYSIIRKSLDARKKNNIVYKYRVIIDLPECIGRPLLKNKEITEVIDKPLVKSAQKINLNRQTKIIIIGSGPCGLFSAIRLIEAGFHVKIFERGKMVDERLKDIKILEKTGILNFESNVLFGEGGAGTYSDGKLTTRIRRPETYWFFSKLVSFGAPESINYEARPHLGTDRLAAIVKNIRKKILDSGSEIFFNTKVAGILHKDGCVAGIKTSLGDEYPCEALILAAGHSARDVYEMLRVNNVSLEKKDFALGVRVEHPTELINFIQYGNSKYKNILPAADYFLAYNNKKTGRGTYSFCMCPGGSVINSSSEEAQLCTNGMSFSNRDSGFSNSAIIVTIKKDDTQEEFLSGIEFQRMIERSAFIAGGGGFRSPAQRITSFISNKLDYELPHVTYANGVTPARLIQYLPGWIADEIKIALHDFNRKMKGFITNEGMFIGAETRSSSPLRIVRGGDLQSVNVKGLYPAGEGSGYAGGIVSSAVDGIRAADEIIKRYG